MDAKKGKVTVTRKDQDGKEVDKTFYLAEDAEYVDDTGRVATIDVFRSDDEVLIVEREGKIAVVKNSAKQDSHHRSSDSRRQDNQDDEEASDRGNTHRVGVMLSDHGNENGMHIGKVIPGSPAEQAGLMKGDRITEINRQRMHSYRDVVDYLNHLKPQQTATIAVVRDGQDHSFKATFASRGRVYGDGSQDSQTATDDRRDNNSEHVRNSSDNRSQHRRTDSNDAHYATLGIDLDNNQNAGSGGP